MKLDNTKMIYEDKWDRVDREKGLYGPWFLDILFLHDFTWLIYYVYCVHVYYAINCIIISCLY